MNTFEFCLLVYLCIVIYLQIIFAIQYDVHSFTNTISNKYYYTINVQTSKLLSIRLNYQLQNYIFIYYGCCHIFCILITLISKNYSMLFIYIC